MFGWTWRDKFGVGVMMAIEIALIIAGVSLFNGALKTGTLAPATYFLLVIIALLIPKPFGSRLATFFQFFAAMSGVGSIFLWSFNNSVLSVVLFATEILIVILGWIMGLTKILDLDIGEPIKSLQVQAGSGSSVAFSPDGEYLAAGLVDKTIRMWNLRTSKHLYDLLGHTGEVLAIAFDPKGKTIVSASTDNTVKLWELRTQRVLRDMVHPDWVWTVAFDPSGNLLATGCADGKVRLWKVLTGELVYTFSGHVSVVRSVAFSPDGTLIASGSDDGHCKIFQVSSGQLVADLRRRPRCSVFSLS